jgi:purine-nucleoside phosphorylase
MATVTFAARSAILAGAQVLILTNAAGGIASGLAPGDLVLLSDHINFAARNPLLGTNEASLGPRFPDMTAVYDAELRAVAREVDPALKEGVYAWLLGPTFETPAEIRAMRTLGADLVGMSTVPEAIVARHMGARVLGVSLVTNLAAGLGTGPLSHEEVQEAAATARERFLALLIGVLERL